MDLKEHFLLQTLDSSGVRDNGEFSFLSCQNADYYDDYDLL